MAQVFKSAYVDAAAIAGRAPIMDQTANKIARRARAEAAKHRLTGATLQSIHVEVAGDGKDRLVVADGEGIVPIEFGYLRMIRAGTRIMARRMPGLGIMRAAFNSIPRNDG